MHPDFSEKMTLEQVRDRIKHLEQSMESARITATEFHQWHASVESALAPRVVTDEDVVDALCVWDASPITGNETDDAIAMRDALEAYERNRK